MQAETGVIDIATVPDDWESLTTVGQAITKEQDGFRWALGDLAIRVDKKYGDGSLKKFATEIRMPKAATLYDYHRAAKYYPISTRAEYPLLSWSHYRAAMKVGQLNASLRYLAQADDSDMPVAAMAKVITRDMGQPLPPVRREFGVLVLDGSGDVVRFNIGDSDAFWTMVRDHPAATVTVTVSYPAKEPTNGN